MERLIAVDEIRVEGRHRTDMGDLDGLCKSIEDVGLINPVTVSPDMRLIAGGRRLEAFRRLGLGEIPSRVVESITDAAAALRAERDENTEREPMRVSELVALARELEEIERPYSEQRRREAASRAGKIARGTYAPEDDDPSFCSREQKDGNARDIAADAVGLSPSVYFRARKVVEAAGDDSEPSVQEAAKAALADMDATGNVTGNYNKVQAARRAREDAQQAKAAALVDEPAESAVDWVPSMRDGRRFAIERRRELIREWAAAGWTSQQIAERLDTRVDGIRKIARENHIDIPADAVFGRGGGKGIDSNRVIQETVNSLEGLDLALDMVDFDDLDQSQIENWTVSISKSIRVLNRLNKQLKEKVQ